LDQTLYNDDDRWSKAIVDYTSLALRPPIGDAAYRQRAGGGPSHRYRQHAQKIW